MLPDDGLRVVQQDAGALEVQGHGDDVVSARAGEQPPKTDDGTPETLTVAPGNRDGREAVAKTAVYPFAGGPERGALPVVKLDPKLRSEGEEREGLFHTPQATWSPGLGVPLPRAHHRRLLTGPWFGSKAARPHRRPGPLRTVQPAEPDGSSQGNPRLPGSGSPSA